MKQRKLKTIEQIQQEFKEGKVRVENHVQKKYYIVYNDSPSARQNGHNVHENRIEIDPTWTVAEAFACLTDETGQFPEYEITSIVKEV